MVSTRHSMLSNMRTGVVTHSAMDNNDGRQESVTGFGTTRDTSQTLLQLPTEEEKEYIPQIGKEVEVPLDIAYTEKI